MAVIFGTQGRDTLDGTGLDDIIQGWAKDRDALTDLGDELVPAAKLVAAARFSLPRRSCL